MQMQGLAGAKFERLADGRWKLRDKGNKIRPVLATNHPNLPILGRSFVTLGRHGPGRNGAIPNLPPVTSITMPGNGEAVDLTIINRWAGGKGVWKVGTRFESARKDGGEFILDGETRRVRQHDFSTGPLVQFIEVPFEPPYPGEFRVVADVNGADYYSYTLTVSPPDTHGPQGGASRTSTSS